MDLRQTQNYSHYMQTIGWKVEKLSKNYIYLKKIPLLGCIAKLQRPLHALNPQQINNFCQKNKVAIFYLEPLKESGIMNHASGFQKAKSCFLPSRTIHIVLMPSEKDIFNKLKKNTRYEIRGAQKQGVVVKKSKDIETFANLWHSSARKRGMWLSLKKEILSIWRSFNPNAQILFAYPKNVSLIACRLSPVAGVLLARSPSSAHYIYAFSTKQGNKLSSPSLLVWEAIKLAKSKGCKIFDLEGIYDDRYPQTKSWQGFTHFKKDFGGKEVTYPPTLVKYYNPIAKLLRL